MKPDKFIDTTNPFTSAPKSDSAPAPSSAPPLDPAALASALAELRADGDHEAAAELLHLMGESDADHDGIPDSQQQAGAPVVAKSAPAMSSLVGSDGGFLVSPVDCTPRRKRKRKRKRVSVDAVTEYAGALLKSLRGSGD